MTTEHFLGMLFQTDPKNFKTLWERQPRQYALANMWLLCKDSEGIEMTTRKLLCKLWSIHGKHKAGAGLIQALKPYPHQQGSLLRCKRDRLEQRLREALTRLDNADTPIDYTQLYADIRYFGPTVQRRWQQEALQETPLPEPLTKEIL